MSLLALIGVSNSPLDKIFGELDIWNILNLRNVCKDLRNVIDNTKPDADIMKLSIRSAKSRIECSFTDRKWNNKSIQFEKVEDGCLVTFGERNHTKLHNASHHEIFYQNISHILRFQKSVLDYFLIYGTIPKNDEYADEVLRKLGQYLSSVPQADALKVENFYIETIEEDHLLRFLPYFDTDCIKSLTVFDPHNLRQDIKVNALPGLRQWWNLRIISFDNMFLDGLITNFFQCINVCIHVEKICLMDLRVLKKAFFRSPILEVFNLKYTEFVDEEDFLKSNYFKRSKREESKNRWLIKMSNCNFVLRILKTGEGPDFVLEFARIEPESVPKNATVWDENTNTFSN